MIPPCLAARSRRPDAQAAADHPTAPISAGAWASWSVTISIAGSPCADASDRLHGDGASDGVGQFAVRHAVRGEAGGIRDHLELADVGALYRPRGRRPARERSAA